MRACPYCAEEIQDAAVVCKHCRRDLSAAPAATTAKVSGSRTRQSQVLVGALIAAALVIFFALRPGSDSAANVSQAGAQGPPPPTIITIADTNGVDIAASKYLTYTFSVSDPRPCTIEGHVLGLAGGNKDVEVLLFDSDGLTNWKNNNSAKVLFNGGKATATTISARLPGPGTYHLVLNNVFSVLTDKTVQVRAKVTCA